MPRSTSPARTSVMPPPTAVAVPTRRATWFATGASRPMHSTGRVVSTPIQALLRPRSARMVWASGGRLAISVRRFAATSTSEVTTAQVGTPWGWRVTAASERVVTGPSIPRRSGQVGLGHDLQRLVVVDPCDDEQVDHHRPHLSTDHLRRQPGGRVDPGREPGDPLEHR